MFEWGLALLQACVSKGSPASLPSPAPGCLPYPGQAAAQDTHTQKPSWQAHPLTCWQGQHPLLLSFIYVPYSSQEKKRKDYAFQRRFDEKPSIIPGCPGMEQPT